MLNIALVGAGGMGSNHASCYRQLEDARLTAVVDIDPQAAARVAGDEAQTFTTLQEALGRMDVDVVDICTPTPVHSEIAVAAIEAGKHVLVEKPMARTPEQCDAIQRAAAGTAKVTMVAHVLRFFPEFASAKKAIDAGLVGAPAMVRTSRGGLFPRGSGSWYEDFDQSGGAILDLIVHDFDWLLWCLGPADRVYAKGMIDQGRKGMDYALVTIRFASGAIAHVEGTWMRPSGFEVKFEVAGDGGLIDYSSKTATPLRFSVRGSEGARAPVEVPESPTAESPYLLEIKHFLECIKTGQKPMIGMDDARAAVDIAFAAIESIRTGQSVSLKK